MATLEETKSALITAIYTRIKNAHYEDERGEKRVHLDAKTALTFADALRKLEGDRK